MRSRITSSGWILGLGLGWVVGAGLGLGWWQAERPPAPMAVTRTDTVRVMTDRMAVQTRQTGARVLGRADTLAAVLRAAEPIVSDSTATSDTLRAALVAVSREAERFRGEVLTYQATVDSLLTAQLVERQAWEAERRAWAAVAGGCGRVRCPTRWQAFSLGVVVAVMVAVLP